MRIGKVALALVSAMALLVTGYAYHAVDTLRDNVTVTDALDDAGGPADSDGAVDILLVGTDARTDSQGHPLSERMLKTLRTEHKDGVKTDTLILFRLPAGGGRPTAVSIPRDSWVRVPAGGKDKINSVFDTAKQAALARLRERDDLDAAARERRSDHAGRAALIKVIQNFTGVRVDHYAEVSLLGFYLVTEALGGVEVCLRNATADPHSGADFAAGRHVVKGGEALSFVRQRRNLVRGDLDRIVRQQVFLSAALKKVLSAGTLGDADKRERLMAAVRRSVVLDRDLELLDFAGKARKLTSGGVRFVTIPIDNIAGRSADGQSIVEVDAEKVREFVASTVRAGAAADADAGRGPGGGSSPAGGRSPRGGVPCVN